MSTESAPDLVARIDALLPQTQCTRCGYPACRPYAAAIAGGEAPINQCPPGGAATIHALASLLGRAVLPLNPANGIEAPPRVAWIDESRCIGCARCLPPCPVDAIIGAAKFMHTVIADRCTGCELCIAPCPVDCIEMRPRHAPAEDQAESEPCCPTQPDLTQPDLTQPDLTQPDPTQPDLTQPDLTQPDLTQPDLTQPDLTQPDVTQPDLNRTRYIAHTERLQRHSAARQRELAAKKASAQRTPV